MRTVPPMWGGLGRFSCWCADQTHQSVVTAESGRASSSKQRKVKDLLDAMRSIPYVKRHDYYDDDFAKKRRNDQKSVSTN